MIHDLFTFVGGVAVGAALTGVVWLAEAADARLKRRPRL